MPAAAMVSPTDGSVASTPEEEKKMFKELTEVVESSLKEGDLFFVLSFRWWKQWSRYVGMEERDFVVEPLSESSKAKLTAMGVLSGPKRPGPIDNKDLLASQELSVEDGAWELKDKLQDDKDYTLVPELCWKMLHKWYGGGPEIPRRVIKVGHKERVTLLVEVYPLRLVVKRASVAKEEVSFRMSKKASVGALCDKACAMFGIKSDSRNVRIWDYFLGSKQKVLQDQMQTLEEADLQMGQELLLDEKVNSKWFTDAVPAHASADAAAAMSNGHGDGPSTGLELAIVPAGAPSRSIAGGPLPEKRGLLSGWGFGSSFSQDGAKDDTSWFGGGGGGGGGAAAQPRGPVGLTGLSNLGNTCFMNSALQCLVHTPPLVEYFMGDYSADINKNNPLGQQGELAVAFGDLLCKLWSPGKQPIAPRAFKTRLAKFAPQFSGYNQHDSQELLAFLLDGLHEDLNRVQKKPYIEAKDADGRPDDEVADEYWANHKARNDSVIVDTCQGQYKSTLVCPVCHKVSIMFDPFMYLSLPLPSKATRSVAVTVLAAGGDAPLAPRAVTVTVAKLGKVRDLVAALGSAVGLVVGERLLLVEVYMGKIYHVFDQPNDALSTIQDNDRLVAYRLPEGAQDIVAFFQRAPEQHLLSSGLSPKLIAVPLVAAVPEGPLRSGRQLYELALAAARCIYKPVAAAPPQGQRSLPDESGAGEGAGSATAGRERRAVDEEGAGVGAAGPGGMQGVREARGPLGGDDKVQAMDVDRPGDREDTGASVRVVPGGLSHEESSGEGVSHKDGEAGAAPSAGAGGADGEVEMVDGESASAHPEGEGADGSTQEAACEPGGSAHVDEGAAAGMAADMDVRVEPGGGQEGAGDVEAPPPGRSGGNEEGHKYPFRLFVRERSEPPDGFVDAAQLLPPGFEATLTRVQGRLGLLYMEWEAEGVGNYDLAGLEDIAEAYKAVPLNVVRSKRESTTSLYQCLEAFLREEPLGPDDMWYCPRCKEHRQASKKLDLWRLPEILVVHLKRFSYSRWMKNKLDTGVNFPLRNLDLRQFTKGKVGGSSGGSGGGGSGAADSHLYDLYAISNHYGGLGGGHYTAHVMLENEGSWYTFDDSTVSAVKEADISLSAAYVLFYKRQKPSLSHPAPGFKPDPMPESCKVPLAPAVPLATGRSDGLPVSEDAMV